MDNRSRPDVVRLRNPYKDDYGWATAQYRAGRPIEDVARDIEVPKARLFDYFSDNGISRDLTKQIHDRATDILNRGEADPDNGLMPTTDEEVIAINATLQAALIRQHRDDINKFRRLAMQMLNEIEHQTINPDLYEDLGTILRSENKDGVDKVNDVYQRVISTPGRVDGIKKLAEVLKILITLEREAFGMYSDYEDMVIRKSKAAASVQKPKDEGIVDDYAAIASKFQSVIDAPVKVVKQVEVVDDRAKAPSKSTAGV